MLTLENAKWHLRIDSTADDAELTQKLALAAALVAQYIGTPRDGVAPTYSATQAAAIDAATLLVLGELWMNREASEANPLSPGVRLILEGLKVPSYA